MDRVNYKNTIVLATLVLGTSLSLIGMDVTISHVHSAARRNKVDELAALLQNGADVNAVNDQGKTALHVAATAGHQKVIMLLLGYDADVNARTPEGQTAFDLADENGQGIVAGILKALITPAVEPLNNGRPRSLSKASTTKVVPKQELKKTGLPNLTMKDSEGKTVLHKAAEKGSLNQVNELLAKGADGNAKNNNGGTPLHAAAFYGHVGIGTSLIEAGVEINEVNNFGNTALHVAALKGRNEVCELLMKKGIDVTIKNANGHTALEVAQTSEQAGVIKVLTVHRAKEQRLSSAARESDSQKLSGHNADSQKRRPTRETPPKPASNESKQSILHKPEPARHNIDIHAVDAEGRTQLHEAASNGEKQLVEALIAQGADVNAQDKNQITPLSAAVWNGHKAITEILIAHGANLSLKDKNGSTPVFRAAQQGHAPVLELLLSKGADVRTVCGNNWTPLHYAAIYAHKEVVRLLLSKGADINATNQGFTPLHQAVRYSRDFVTRELRDTSEGDEIVKFLVSKGANAQALDSEGKIPLHYAPTAEMAKALIAAFGAGANLRSTAGWTPFYTAAIDGRSEVLDYFLKNRIGVPQIDAEGFSPLHIAAQRGMPEASLRMLVAHGMNVNAVNKVTESDKAGGCTPLALVARSNLVSLETLKATIRTLISLGANVDSTDLIIGWSPLILASVNGQVEVGEVLISHGAQVNKKTKDGSTPFSMAVGYGHIKMATMLIAHGANVDNETTHGRTPLLMAVLSSSAAMVELLLDNKASIEMSEKDGTTILHEAIYKYKKDIVEVLLKHGVKTNAQNKNGATALHLAAYHGHVDCAGLLIAHGASVNARNGGDRTGIDYNETPLHTASKRGHSLVVELLIEKGADVDAICDFHGNAPLHLAAANGHTDVAKILLKHQANPNLRNGGKQTARDLALAKGHRDLAEGIAQAQKCVIC